MINLLAKFQLIRSFFVLFNFEKTLLNLSSCTITIKEKSYVCKRIRFQQTHRKSRKKKRTKRAKKYCKIATINFESKYTKNNKKKVLNNRLSLKLFVKVLNLLFQNEQKSIGNLD